MKHEIVDIANCFDDKVIAVKLLGEKWKLVFMVEDSIEYFRYFNIWEKKMMAYNMLKDEIKRETDVRVKEEKSKELLNLNFQQFNIPNTK